LKAGIGGRCFCVQKYALNDSKNAMNECTIYAQDLNEFKCIRYDIQKNKYQCQHWTFPKDDYFIQSNLRCMIPYPWNDNSNMHLLFAFCVSPPTMLWLYAICLFRPPTNSDDNKNPNEDTTPTDNTAVVIPIHDFGFDANVKQSSLDSVASKSHYSLSYIKSLQKLLVVVRGVVYLVSNANTNDWLLKLYQQYQNNLSKGSNSSASVGLPDDWHVYEFSSLEIPSLKTNQERETYQTAAICEFPNETDTLAAVNGSSIVSLFQIF